MTKSKKQKTDSKDKKIKFGISVAIEDNYLDLQKKVEAASE